jgi:vitamin B12 transporter
MTTRPTYVIDRAKIQAQGDRTVADALRDVPGVTMFRYGAFGAQANYGVLGATSEQTLVLVNGFPVAAGSSGSIDLGTFSTVDVERIEVVEGGGSTLYGSSAVGGIINIITGHTPKSPYLELADGTYGEQDARIEVGQQGFGLGFERHIAANSFAFPSQDGFPAGTRTNDWAQATAGRLDYQSNPNSSYTFDASLGNDSVKLGVPGNLSFLTPEALQATSQMDGHLSIARHTPNAALILSFSGASARLDYDDPQNGGENDTYDSRTQVSLRDVVANPSGSLVAGADFSRESALLNLGAFSVPPLATAALAQSAVYAQYRDDIAKGVVVTGGLRGEHDAPQGSVLEPSLGTAFAFAGARLSANYAGTFRVPTIDELYYPGFSNPLLVPERSKNLDATFSLPLGAAGASLSWFDRQAVNLIALNANFVPENIARASLAGLIFSGHTAPLHGIVATLGITDMYRALNLTPGQPAVRLDFEPVMTTTLGLERPFAGDAFAFGVNAQIRGPHNESGVLRDGDTTVDAYLRGRFARNLIGSVRVYNLGNERFAPILGYPAPGRTVEFELSTR